MRRKHDNGQKAKEEVPVEIVDRQVREGSAGGGCGATQLSPVSNGRGSPEERAWALVRPLGPSSRFGRLRWGGPCVNCGDMVPPGDRGWIEPRFQQVLCAECWPG